MSVVKSRFPSKILMLSLLYAIMLFLLNITLQPWSHNFPINIRLDEMLGNMCAVPTLTGKVGMGKAAVCVAVIVLLSVRRIEIPLFVGSLLSQGLVCNR